MELNFHKISPLTYLAVIFFFTTVPSSFLFLLVFSHHFFFTADVLRLSMISLALSVPLTVFNALLIQPEKSELIKWEKQLSLSSFSFTLAINLVNMLGYYFHFSRDVAVLAFLVLDFLAALVARNTIVKRNEERQTN